jgi:hypothetical protein
VTFKTSSLRTYPLRGGFGIFCGEYFEQIRWSAEKREHILVYQLWAIRGAAFSLRQSQLERQKQKAQALKLGLVERCLSFPLVMSFSQQRLVLMK